ncbi:MAG: hypothetical protein LC808_05085 [Actinobacteria bacterium]|nr:hypothetical protein [Actinomycetota bacterium]
MSFIQDEPAVFAGLVLAVISAGMNLLIAFGFNLTDVQVAAINGFVNPVIALGLSIFVRKKVTPVAPGA